MELRTRKRKILKHSLLTMILVAFCGIANAQSVQKYRVVAFKKDAPHIESVSNTVEVRKSADLFIPSAFTPNNDGVNDFFTATGEGIDEFEMLIFNRYGQLIFSTSSLDEGWDGTFNSQQSPDGVYVYKIKLINEANSDWIVKEGHVTLLR